MWQFVIQRDRQTTLFVYTTEVAQTENMRFQGLLCIGDHAALEVSLVLQNRTCACLMQKSHAALYY